MMTTPARLLLAAAAAAMIAGCSLTPQLVRPDAPVAPEFPPHAAAPAAANRAAADIGWREFFPDARLQVLIASALENNRDLRTAALRIQEARAQYNVQTADLLPNLNAGVSGSRSRTPAGLSATGGRC
jgi:multidrug efflux system outer membrane protein